MIAASRVAVLLAAGLAWASPVRAEQLWVSTKVAGLTVRARASVDPARTARDSSRFDMQLAPPPGGPYAWDFTLPDEPGYHYRPVGVTGASSPRPYGRARRVTVRAELWQYVMLEERITFHDLDLCPLPKDDAKLGITPRFLVLRSAITAVTPSGIRITLPAQDQDILRGSFNGNLNALWIRIETKPSQREVAIPESPLYRKHKKPARILLDCDRPNHMVTYMADNTDEVIGIGLPGLRTAMHLDSLTLVVRQRINLRGIPVAIRLPIARSPK